MKLSLRKMKANGRRDEQDSLEDALTKNANTKDGVTVTEKN